jgi:O-antigen ligase
VTAILKFIQDQKQHWISIGLYTLGITFFLIPFPRIWNHYSLGAFLALSLLYWVADFQVSLSNLKKGWYIAFPFIAYFLLYLFDLVIRGTGWSVIGRRFIFLLFPLIGISLLSSSDFISKRTFIVKAFITGMFLVSVFLIIRAGLMWFGLVDKPKIPENTFDSANPYFLSVALSFFQHPGYFSMELNFAIILLIVFRQDLNFSNLFRIFLIFFFLGLIYIISSRAGVLAAILSLVYLIYNKLHELKLKWFYYFLIPPGVALALVVLIILNPRISDSFKGLKEKLNKSESVKLRDIEPRTRVWYSSLQLIKDYPLFGIGARDLDQQRINEYRRNSFYAEAFFILNTHNQFLETQLTFGISGSILLIWMIFTPFLTKSKNTYRALSVSFLIIIIVHFMFESMLVRQWGIIFFVLFSLFLVFINNNVENSTKSFSAK